MSSQNVFELMNCRSIHLCYLHGMGEICFGFHGSLLCTFLLRFKEKVNG